MMAPPRANAPPRALFWNAKFSPNGTRESVPAGSVKCPRSKTWDAQRSAAETQTLQELRDRWDTLDVDGTCHPCHMRVTWCVEPTAANPHDARPARGSATPLIGVCVKHKEPFRFFRKHSFAFLVLQPVAAFGKVALTPRTERCIPWKGIKNFAVDKKQTRGNNVFFAFRLPKQSPFPCLLGTGTLDRTCLANACATMGAPTGDEYVDELWRSLSGGNSDSGDGDVSSGAPIDFSRFAARERRREREYHTAWQLICAHADFGSGPDAGKEDTMHKKTKTEKHAKMKHDASSAIQRTLGARELAASARALGILNPAGPDDLSAMLSSLARKEITTGDRTGVLGYCDFKRYAVLLPNSRLARDDAARTGALAAPAAGSVRNPDVETQHSHTTNTLFAGGLAGVVARTAVAPLDRARTIMQDLHPSARDLGSPSTVSASASGVGTSGPKPKPAPPGRCRGLTGTVSKVLKEEGIKGLWRGNAVTVLKVVPCNALQFAIFHGMKDWFARRREGNLENGHENGKKNTCNTTPLTLFERLLSGSLAGAISTAVCYPLDVVKSQMAVRGGLQGSAVRAARQMFIEQGGARAFYKGLGATLLCDVIGTGLGFTLYDGLNLWYQKNVLLNTRKPSPAEKGFLGGTSACVCLTATQPFEVVMTQMRVQGCGGRPVVYKNMLHCLRIVCKREGWRGLWRGTGAAYAKIFPQLALTYYVFELVSEQMGVGGVHTYDAGKRTGEIVTS